MNQTIYLVKKNPGASSQDTEWLQLTGREFYKFIRSPEGQGRYFIRLTDDISFECPEIFIEGTYQEFRKWKSDYNRHQYLKEQEEGFETLSGDLPVTDDSCLVDPLADDTASPEELVLETLTRHQLREAVAKLSVEEQKIVYRPYLAKVPQKQQDLAQELGIRKDVLTKRKKKIFKKIFDLLGNF